MNIVETDLLTFTYFYSIVIIYEKGINMATEKRITINDVAKAAGVSKATVSRYLNGRVDLISSATQERIASVIKMTNYQPSELARNLKKTTTNFIGVIVSQISSPFSPPLFTGISEHLESRGYIPMLMDSSNSLEREKKAINSLIARGVSGILITTSSYENNFLVEHAAKGMPIVLCDRYVKDHNFDIVTNKNDKITRELFNHLKSNGYTKVALFSETIHNSSSRIRSTQVFCDAASEVFGYDASEDIYEIKQGEEQFTLSQLELFLCKLNANDIPAIVCNSAITTIMLFKAIKKTGRRIPDEIGLSGIEDWDLNNAITWPNLVSPEITTIVVEPQLIGKKAAELLISRINDTSKQIEEIILQDKLIIRKSTQRKL